MRVRCFIVRVGMGCGLLHVNVEAVGFASRVFKLQGAAGDAMALFNDLLYLAAYPGGLADGHVIDHNMRRQQSQASGQAPYVQMVYPPDAVNLQNIPNQGADLDIIRGAFHQDVEGFPHDQPGIPEDEAANQQANRRIQPGVSGQADTEADHDRPQRGKGISHQMQKGTVQVDVFAGAVADQPGSKKVNTKGNGPHCHQQGGVDRWRSQKTLPGLVENAECHQAEGGCIDQGGQNTDPMIAECFTGMGRTLLQPEGKGRQQQCRYVGEIVEGIRQQGQAVCQQAGQDLCHNQDQGQQDGYAQSQLYGLITRRRVGVMMVTCHDGTSRTKPVRRSQCCRPVLMIPASIRGYSCSSTRRAAP